jgi:hypothetical protein
MRKKARERTVLLSLRTIFAALRARMHLRTRASFRSGGAVRSSTVTVASKG